MSLQKTVCLRALFLVLAVIIAGCGTHLPERPAEGRHITPDKSPVPKSIPEVVQTPSLIAPPRPETKLDVYSVVVNDVPVRELLFALARDASLNIDIHPGIDGKITLS